MSEQQKWSIWFESNKLPELWSLFQKLIQKPAEKPGWTIDNWEPTQSDRAFAWEMYVELRTRISTQPLHFLSGDEATALDSLYQLFQIVRDLEKKHGVGGFVSASLTSFVLNSDIRPVTARWHRMKLEGKLHPEDLRREFRATLLKLQPKLRAFQKLLLRIAGISHDDGSDTETEKVSEQQKHKLGESVPFDQLLGYDCTCKVPPSKIVEIVAAETREIQDRRDAVRGVVEDNRQKAKAVADAEFSRKANSELAGKLDSSIGADGKSVSHTRSDKTSYHPVENIVGLAISGGGIRSATFALGVLQGLTQRGIFKQVDLVSTVSGGGYLGSFLSTYLNTDNPNCGPTIEKAPFKPEVAGDSRAIRSLRNNSRYIQPSSFRRWLTTVGQVAYGIVSNLILLSLWVFIAVLVTKISIHCQIKQVYAEAMGLSPLSFHHKDWSLNDVSKYALISSGLMLFFLPTIQRLRKMMGFSFSRPGWYELATPVAFVATGLVILVNLTPNFHYLYYRFMRWIGETYLGAGTAAGNGTPGWSLTATFVAAKAALLSGTMKSNVESGLRTHCYKSHSSGCRRQILVTKRFGRSHITKKTGCCWY